MNLTLNLAYIATAVAFGGGVLTATFFKRGRPVLGYVAAASTVVLCWLLLSVRL